jgi:hypothetical protein
MSPRNLHSREIIALTPNSRGLPNNRRDAKDQRFARTESPNEIRGVAPKGPFPAPRKNRDAILTRRI